MRHRSDSRGLVDGPHDVSDFELDTGEEQDVAELNEKRFDDMYPALKRSVSKPSNTRANNDWSALPFALSQGTFFEKVTKRKKKLLKFYLDEPAAKVYWSNGASSFRKQIYVDDIKEIRAGELATNYLEEFEVPKEFLPRWFTIIYFDPDRSKGRSVKSMHLIAPSENVCAQWTSSLQYMMKSRDDLMTGMAGHKEKSREAHWRREMVKKFGMTNHAENEETMDFAGIKRTCRSFSISKSESDLKAHFERLDLRKTGALNFLQYLQFFRHLTDRSDVNRIYESIKPPLQATLNLDDFLNFLQRLQGMDVGADRAYWESTFEKYASERKAFALVLEGALNGIPSKGMTSENFRNFLLSAANTALISQSSSPTLNRPLNEYFISSSHNTYLMGRQVGGESSPEGYIACLKKGCRCIEIDCWDGDDGKPRVTHGRTFSTRVSFLDCVKAINQYAFCASSYPLIISLEVHCNPEQQKVMAEIMKDQFGTQLLLSPRTAPPHLPSPEDLKGRILIKVKEPKKTCLSTPQVIAPPISHRRQRSVSAPDPRTASNTLSRFSTPPISPIQLSPTVRLAVVAPQIFSSTSIASTSTGTSGSSSDDSDFDENATKQKKVKTSNIVNVLGDMGVYTRGIAFSDFRSQSSKTYNHVYSFRETTFENKCKTVETKALLEKHNSRYLMRVYPKGSRVNSSNFDPLQFWRRGVQMVATNWQTHDLGTQINDAMFAAGSDWTGYVLKPAELRLAKDDIADGSRKPKKKMVKFSVDIISAQYLEAPSDLRPGAGMNPYVEFEMYSAEDKAKGIATGQGGMDASARNGMSGIGSPLRKRTRIVEGNGYDPMFHESITMTLETKYPSLVFVRWTVWHSPDGRNLSTSKEPLSSFTAKLSSLQQGYRHLTLNNRHGEPLISKLFCRITKEDQRDVDQKPGGVNGTTESPRISSEEGARPGKFSLSRVFHRTGSERKKSLRDTESGSSTRGSSTRSASREK